MTARLPPLTPAHSLTPTIAWLPLHAPGAPLADAPTRYAHAPTAAHRAHSTLLAQEQRAPRMRLMSSQFEELLRLARARPELAWHAGNDISMARNAHFTNTAGQMAEALASDANFLEGDVRIAPDGELIMAHSHEDADGMSLEEWLEIAKRSGRGMKLDIKVSSAILPTLQMLLRHRARESRLIINLTVVSRELDTVATLDQLHAARRLFPASIVNLSVTVDRYTRALHAQLGRFARAIGGPVMFPLRADLVTPQTVAELRRFGRVAVWNTPELYAPRDVATATAMLRSWGVDGTIDLRPASGWEKVLHLLVESSVKMLGWRATLRVLSHFS